MPAPDSAGIVEMVNGLAYGGIPYGSVSGALANYNQPQRLAYPYNSLQASASVLVPDTRTAPIGY
ncbi:uncharacterized protein LOC100123749 [Nasonia vitripennis]|nr:uncharacterized protein LOC100123749 [Nasonia vitripennis]